MKEQFFEMGNEAFDNKDYENAINYYHKALEFDGNNIDIYYNLSIALYESGDYEKSIKISDRVIELDEFFIYKDIVWFNKGNCYHSLKQYKNAEAEFTKIIDYNPYDSSAYFNRANAREKLGDANGASVDRRFCQFLERSDQLQDLYRSHQADNIEDYNLDKFNLDKSNLLNEIQQNPKSYSLYFELGNAYAKIREFIKAIEYFEIAIKHYPEKFYNTAHQNIIAANFDLQEYQKVIELADKYTQHDKNNFAVNDMKGWAMEEINDQKNT